MPANQQLLGTTHRLLPVGLGTADRAATMDRMNRAHTLIRRYEGAVTSVKELVKMCKAEGKKLRLIEDECNDLVESGTRKTDVEVEVYLTLDPMDAVNDRIVVMRTDPGHEGEVVSSTPLTDKQRAEVEKGVLPGFEDEPRIPADMVPELADDPNVAAFVKESEDSEAVASRVLGESATQIGSVLDQIGLIAASYPKDEAQPKRRGRKPKSEQMTLPVVTSSAPVVKASATTTPSIEGASEPVVSADESPWNNLPAPGFAASDEQIADAKDRAYASNVEHMDDASEPEDALPMGGDVDPVDNAIDQDAADREPVSAGGFDVLTPTAATDDASETTQDAPAAADTTSGDSDDSEAQEETPPLDEETPVSVQTIAPLPVMVVSSSPEVGSDDASEASAPTPDANTDLADRLMAQAQEAKREREAKIAVKEAAKIESTPVSDAKSAPLSDASADAKIRELGITDSFRSALTRMLTKKIEDAGSITTAELSDLVRDKIKSGVKGDDLTKRLSAIPYVLRSAAAGGAKIASTTVDGKDGWMVKAD